MQVTLFDDDPDHTLTGELVVVEYDHMVRPVTAVIRDADGAYHGFELATTNDGSRLFFPLDIDCSLLCWMIYDQHPADSRHRIFSSLPLEDEHGAVLPTERLVLMGWERLAQLIENPFNGAMSAVVLICEVCGGNYAEGYECQHIIPADEADDSDLAST